MENKEKAQADLEKLKINEKEIALVEKRINEIKAMKEKAGIEVNEDELAKQIQVNWLGKLQLINEVGELADKDVYITFEMVDGQMQLRYYDEDQRLLGVQQAIDKDIILASTLSTLEPDKQDEIKEWLEESDKEKAQEEAKDLEQLKEEQKHLQEMQEKEHEGPQLTQKQVNSLTGPKIDLNQKVDNVTLADKVDLDGKYIQFVDIDAAKELIPDLNVEELGQQFIPIEILQDGSANVVGEDKLKFSTMEGSNSTNEQTTMNNDGSRRQEQGIVTFDIPRTNNCITIGFDEQGTSSPFYEAKFGTRDIEQPSEVLYDELETVNEGPLKQEKEKAFAQMNNTEGVYEASKEEPNDEQAKRFIEKSGMFWTYDENGKREYDIEQAKRYLRENSIGDQNIEELIEQADDEFGRPLGESNDPHAVE